MSTARPLAKLLRGAFTEGLSYVWIATVSGHHNVWGLLERPGAGDRLRRWRPGDRLPVVFCHGYLGDATNFLLLRRRLYTDGSRSQATVWLWPFWRACDDYARLIGRRVDRVLAQTGAPAVDLVAHSMGGLAARRYLADLGDKAVVRRLVTIGTPHRGTLAALAGPGRSAEDLCPESRFLRGLAGDLAALGPGKILSVHGDLDWLAPPSTSRVPPPQENLLLDGLGHSGLLCSPRVHRAVREALPPIARRRDVLGAPAQMQEILASKTPLGPKGGSDARIPCVQRGVLAR